MIKSQITTEGQEEAVMIALILIFFSPDQDQGDKAETCEEQSEALHAGRHLSAILVNWSYW